MSLAGIEQFAPARASVPPGPPVFAVPDPIEGALLVVAGGRPLVYRVVGPHLTDLSRFDVDPVHGQHFEPGMLWPDFIPLGAAIYPAVHVVPASALRTVDLLWVWYGSSYRGTAGDGHYLWQPASTFDPLVRLSPTQARHALASRWRASFDPRTADAPTRGIRLFE